MSLNPRQRTKVNAALSLIALHGHNPRQVQQAAKAHISKGVPHAEAYSAALNAFAGNVPAMGETLATILELVQHSDDATLGRYDAAINQFNQTGDNSALTALEPMIVDDFKALIVKRGLASPEDAAALDLTISDALAFNDGAVSTDTGWIADASQGLAQPHTEGNEVNTPLTPKEYAQAVRELQNSLKGRPLETSPEYAALQARLPGNRQAAPAPGLEVRNGQAFRGGERTATGYRAAMTGERARSWHGSPSPDAFGGFATAEDQGGQA